MVEGSINAFLRGKKNQNWVIGEIRTSGIKKEALKKLFTEFHKGNLGNVQLLELENECFNLKFI